jgi:hypothetical protein
MFHLGYIYNNLINNVEISNKDIEILIQWRSVLPVRSPVPLAGLIKEAEIKVQVGRQTIVYIQC